MAPLALDIPDLSLSSLELDARSSSEYEPSDFISPTLLPKSDHHDSIYSRIFHKRSDDGVPPILSPSETFKLLTARDAQAVTTSIDPAAGSINPEDINMKAIQAVFAIIGASFVIGTIWFFFWAKNGGFQWRKGDWEDYKSTVLRRKGPNGTTLSNATNATWEDGTNHTVTDLSSEAPVIKEKSRRGGGGAKKQREKAKAAKIREVREETWEGGHDDDVRAYRQEQPARVGGMNKKPDSQYYGTDYSFSEGPEKPARASSRVPGSFDQDSDYSDLQSQYTKTYHHPLPGKGSEE
ncbi:hypothetical protein DV735_g1720, partial [Chaetothyriales sp. CBS 134920]